MNQSKFSFYRMADGSLFKKAGLKLEPYEFSYSSSDGGRPVTRSSKSEDLKIELPGANCDWVPARDDLTISRKCVVDKPAVFFGEKKGVAAGDAEIGLAVVISSVKSSFRRTVPYDASILDGDGPVSLNFTHTVPARTLLGDFSLRTVLYLKSPCTADPPAYLSNSSGTVLGSPEPFTGVYIDDYTPEFPTRVLEEGSRKPLWRLLIEWRNPLTDGFMDSVCVILNKDNPAFKTLKLDSENKNMAALNEIYSSAILQIIAKLRDEDRDVWKDTVSGNPEAICEGSVSDFVYYMLSQRFNTDGSDLVKLSYEIRRILQG